MQRDRLARLARMARRNGWQYADWRVIRQFTQDNPREIAEAIGLAQDVARDVALNGWNGKGR